MAVVEVNIVPIGTGSPSVSKHIARVVRILQGEPEIKYTQSAMGTIIEGKLNQIFSVVRKMHEAAFNEEVARVITTVKIDDRRDKELSIEGKLGSLNRELKQINE